MQYRYKTLTHNPELLPLLFRCALVARHSCYPEFQVDGIICKAITFSSRVTDTVDGVAGSQNVGFYKLPSVFVLIALPCRMSREE